MGQFGEQAAALHRILVANLISHEVSVTLFAADHVLTLALLFPDGFRDVFEARERFADFHTVVLGQIDQQIGGDHGFGHKRRLVQLSRFLPFRQDVIGQQGGSFIAVEQHKIPVAIGHGQSHSIRIWVGAHHQRRVLFAGQSHRLRQCRSFLWVGACHRGKGSVRDGLRSHFHDVSKSECLECWRHSQRPRAVQASEHNGQV